MNNIDEIAKKNNRKGIVISVLVHVMLLLLFLFATVWQEPYPPKPEYGIELNFGLSDAGRGNEPVANEQPVEEVEAQVPEEVTEENTEAVEEQVETAETVEETTEDPTTEALQEDGIVEEQKKPETKKEAEKAVETKEAQVQKVAEKKVEEKPKPNPNAMFPGNNASQGETNKDGDQGVKDGEVDAKALMGSQGGGNGSTLEMSGWAWNAPPRPNDTSDQNGKIVFQIKVDDRGEVIKVDVLETTVSPDVVSVYRREVERLSFYKTSSGTTLSSYTGKITFIIRSR